MDPLRLLRAFGKANSLRFAWLCFFCYSALTDHWTVVVGNSTEAYNDGV